MGRCNYELNEISDDLSMVNYEGLDCDYAVDRFDANLEYLKEHYLMRFTGQQAVHAADSMTRDDLNTCPFGDCPNNSKNNRENK